MSVLLLTIFVKKGIQLLKNISQICIVERGSLKFEEGAEGYILRDESVLQGQNYKNGMVQMIAEGQRVAKDKPAFRYYSNGEGEMLNKIASLDDEINAEIESSGLTIFSTDITNLETQIQKVVNSMYCLNELEEIQDRKSELDTYISKKTKITGDLSPADSHVKSLIEQRNALQAKLTNESETILAPISGVLSYRVDGLEEKLGITDFSYLSTAFLEGLSAKLGAVISTSSEKGKVINNFMCYIACPMDSEKAANAKLGDKVKLRLMAQKEVNATIEYIAEEEEDKRVIVFKITDEVEELIPFRKIQVEVIWWSYEGLKVSNSAILEENDRSYIERSKGGYKEKIYVKVLRQNDTYSIVENYTAEELKQIGYDTKELEEKKELNVYDEILLH